MHFSDSRMYHMEFSRSDYKFVLSWNTDHSEYQNTSENINVNNKIDLISRVNELYENIQILSSEFVDCLKQSQNGNTPLFLENRSNLSFQIDDLKHETLSTEKNHLVEELERLKKENECLKLKITHHENEISSLKNHHELNVRDLENKYEDEMSELRIYFEKIYSENLKQLTHVANDHHKIESNSNSDNENAVQHFQVNHNRLNGAESDTDNELETKVSGHETFRKGLKNCIIKVINFETDKFKNLTQIKDEEILKLKKDNEILQGEIGRLKYHKELGEKVKEICCEVRRDYEAYVDNLQDVTDKSFLMALQEENSQEKDKLKQKFENTLNELDSMSEFEISHVSDMLVSFALKSVYFEQHVKKLTEEKEALVDKLNDYRTKNDLRNQEIQTLMKKLTEEFKILNDCDREMDAESVITLVKGLKKDHDHQISKFKAEKSKLREEIRNLEEKVQDLSREKVLKVLIGEIQDLITREQSGECVTWPSELVTLEHIFSKRNLIKVSESPNTNEPSKHQSELNSADMTSNSIELDQLLEERNGLKKVNVALRGVIQMFTKSLTNCEELNNTLIEALVNAEKFNRQLKGHADISFDLNSLATEKHSKQMNVSFNDLEILNLLKEAETLDTSVDQSISVNEADLESWLKILRTEASTVWNLIATQKVDGSETKMSRDKNVQTDLKIGDIDYMDRCIEISEKEIENLKQDVESMQKNILASESIEGYGEAPKSLTQKDKSFSAVANYSSCAEEVLENEIDELPESEECENCDKMRDCAKKIFDDLQTQLTAMEKKCKSNEKFLERQTAEREIEREEFDKKIKQIAESLKEKEKELNRRNNFENEVFNLEQQMKDLTDELESYKDYKESLETKLKLAENKIRQLREGNQELEIKLAQASDRTDQVEIRFKDKDDELRELQVAYDNLLQQLDSWSDGNVNQLEEFNEQHATSTSVIDQMKIELTEIEKLVMARTRNLETEYLIVYSDSVISSPPSEDISVSERIRLISPGDSDLSSSPSRILASINLLSCLNEKLKKLFSAEEAVFKKIQDQDMELSKQKKLIREQQKELSHYCDKLVELQKKMDELELERNTLADSLKTSKDKEAQMKIQLDEWHYRNQTSQSDVQFKLTDKIRSLESQIEHYKKFLSQKDYTESELTKIIKDLRDYIANSECEFSEKCQKTEQIVFKLQKELNGLRQEKKALRKVLEGCDELDSSEEPRTSSSLITRSGSMCTSADSKNSSKKHHVSFAENLESCIDPDVSRRAVTVEISSLPMISPFASPGKPLLMSSGRSASSSIPSYGSAKKKRLDLNIPLPMKLKEPSNDSLDINSDALTSTKNYPEDGVLSSVSEDYSRESQIFELREKIDSMTNMYEKERRSLSKLKNLNNATKHENRFLKDKESILQKANIGLEAELQSVSKTLASYREQCQSYEEQILSLTDQLKSNNHIIDQLKSSSTRGEHEDTKFDYKELVKQKTEVEKKCEVYSKLAEKLEKSLDTEKEKVVELSNIIEKAKGEAVSLQDVVKKLEHSLKRANDELADEKTKVEELNNQLKSMKENAKFEPEPLTRRTGSLKDLTEKVQKEVEIASELDEHMFKRLESTSSNSSILHDLLKISPTLNENVQKTLLKILREGCDILNSEDNRILVESLNLHNPGTFKYLEEKDNKIRNLQNEIDAQRKIIMQNRLEIKNLEAIQVYSDDNLTRYVMKLDEYRKKNNKLEIELTTERCKCSQVENQLQRTIKDLKEGFRKQEEEYKLRNTNYMNENLLLKKEIEKLTNQIEALSTELCSRRTQIDSKSSAESELSRFLNPLKVKLTQEQERYTRLKAEYEKMRNELTLMKSNLKLEKNSFQKLDTMYKASLNENAELQKKLSEMKVELGTLTWQNQRVEDKLKAAEVSDMKMRKLLNSKDASNRAETESSKESQKLLEKEYEALKVKEMNIQKQYNALYDSWKGICLEFQEIVTRCLRAESYRRCLVYQKNFYVVECCNLLFGKRVLDIYSPQLLEKTGNTHLIHKRTPLLKFRGAVICIRILNRIKQRLIKKRDIYKNFLIRHMSMKFPQVKLYPYSDFSPNGIVEMNSVASHSISPQKVQTGIYENRPTYSDLFDDEIDFRFMDDSLKELYLEFLQLGKTY